MNPPQAAFSGSPMVTEMLVIPVAGEDNMLNLRSAHGPFFTGNLVL